MRAIIYAAGTSVKKPINCKYPLYSSTFIAKINRINKGMQLTKACT